jgi:hypothetical protein
MSKPIRMPVYTPTAVDLQWARQMITLLAEGATLVYPATQMIYCVSHKNKTLILQNPNQLLIFPSFVIHYQTIDVFMQIGYTVLPPKEEEQAA